MKRVGIDIGSTTVKCVILDENNQILYKSYRRHMSYIQGVTSDLLNEISNKFDDERMLLSLSGSAGMGLSGVYDIPFVQEVFATRIAVNKLNPDINSVIELGGEDAKILFLDGNPEVRMNGTCAGGTGAFIDQMISLMDIEQSDLNALADNSEKIYTIASRCGVFAKSDIQPLINQGAKKEDIAASIFYAVVNQTIGGLSQGRKIEGNVLYLGGPLTFYPYLRKAFDNTLKLKGTCPDNSLYYVSIGSALSRNSKEYNLLELSEKLDNYKAEGAYASCEPLFTCKEEYGDFIKLHNSQSHIKELKAPCKEMFLGIDAGSTTVKAVLCNALGEIFRPFYTSNSGNPIPIIKDYLKDLYSDYPDINIVSSAVTGYGEEIIKNAFSVDEGIVETVAHYTAAKKFCPEVDFIIDIGGQDIKCFKIKNGYVDSIFLNEACSSGCGSFLQTFAGVLGLSTEEFAQKALFADKPVDLGSRCTVFMNSSIKQAQKDGASIENISAGLAVSVVKNALYKVIRCSDSKALGNNIVVQGGTFQNDAVLRAFEKELGHTVIRPSISGLMGAYGAALYALDNYDNKKSALIDKEKLSRFTHTVKAVTCNKCTNRCKLTVNTFSDGKKYIAGNRCEKPLNAENKRKKYNLYEYKISLLEAYRKNEIDKTKPIVGIPMGLNIYELLPFWYTVFKELGFNVAVSSPSTHELYQKGQYSIPSDTVCYPAKLLHGHIEDLLERKTDIIFYPSMSYNVNESKGHNHYNCPVVAYYPEVIGANIKKLKEVEFISDFIGIHDKKEFDKHFRLVLSRHGYTFPIGIIKKASKKAFAEFDSYKNSIRKKANEYIEIAERDNLPITVLAGRPYHIDSEINHGIDNLICNLGSVLITEDSIAHKIDKFDTTVLNQWTYHARLYSAAKYVAVNKNPNINLVQLVSFGCGVDAVTSDEVRSILESSGKIYTQIKIDEITNLGAVKIRLRSLFSVAKGK